MARPAARSPRSKAATTSISQDRTFRPDIEGLRAIAVGLVLLDHAGLTLVHGGYIGVDVFFVLSGFLITGILFRELERTGSISMRAFYARRARRLLPAGTLVLVLTVIASYLWIGGTRADRIAVDAKWTAVFLANARFILQGTDYMNSTLPPSPVQHYWSLAVEEQFYLVWPLLLLAVVWFAGKRSLRRNCVIALTVVTVGSLAFSVYQTPMSGTVAYFSPFTRAWELGLGGLLALGMPWIRRLPGSLAKPFGWLGLGAIGSAAVLLGPTSMFPGYLALIPVLGTALVVIAGSIRADVGAERVLKTPAMQFIGRLSYSIYLWHWPILVLVAAKLQRDLMVSESLGLCALSIPIAWLTYRLVEQPVRDTPKLRVRRPEYSLAMGAALVVLVVLTSNAVLATDVSTNEQGGNQATVMQLPDQAEVIDAVAEAVDEKTWPEQPTRIKNPAYAGECNVSRKAVETELCVSGNPHADSVAVVLGDSHGAMWIPAFNVIGQERDWAVVQLTKPGCQVPDFRRYSPTMKREYTECDEFRAWALDQIDAIKPDLVLIASSSRNVEQWTDSGPTTDNITEVWTDGLQTVVERVQQTGSRVVLLGEIPYPDEPGIDCLTAHPNDIEACSTPVEDAVETTTIAAERQVAEAMDAGFVDVVPWFCTDSTCPAVIGGLTVHRDDFHIAENYAVWLSNVLGRAVGMVPKAAPLTTVTIPAASDQTPTPQPVWSET